MDRRDFLTGSATGLGLLAVSLSACEKTDPPATAAAAPAAPKASRNGGMERVLGIGGLFFRSRDPRTLARWYAQHLGVELTPTDYDSPSWRQQEGPTVFEPFAADTSYFGRPEQQWMVNFRVRDLAAMAQQLRAAGIGVEVDAEEYPNGVFARLQDPEGNPIQLWEPRGRAGEARN